MNYFLFQYQFIINIQTCLRSYLNGQNNYVQCRIFCCKVNYCALLGKGQNVNDHSAKRFSPKNISDASAYLSPYKFNDLKLGFETLW